MKDVPANIAPGCQCRQSSIDPNVQSDPDAACNAVNGRKTGHASFTTQKEEAPWWRIDLGRRVTLDSVVVYNWDVAGLPYSAAGRSRARFLQIWGSDDGEAWRLLHDRRTEHAAIADFGGIHTGPLWVALDTVQVRHLRLTLSGGGILQLDKVEVYALQERDTESAIRDALQCAEELNFMMARRILAALALPLPDVVASIERLDLPLGRLGTVLLANLLVEQHHGDVARSLLPPAIDASPPPPPAATAPATGDSVYLSIHIPARSLEHGDILSANPPVIPPAALPLALTDPLRLRTIEMADRAVAYLLQGPDARLLCQHTFCDQAALAQGMEAIFARHPVLENIVAADVMVSAAASGSGMEDDTGYSDVLDLPEDFNEYRKAYIVPELRNEIESKAQRFPQLELTVSSAAGMDDATYRHALRWIADAAPELRDRDWPALRRYVRLASLQSAAGPLASAICLEFGQYCYLLGWAPQHQSPDLPDSDLGNIVTYLLLAALPRRGIRHLVFPHAESAVNIRFGALRRPHRILTYQRYGEEPKQQRVLAALARGDTPARIEAEAGLTLEAMLGAQFEAAVQVEFDAIVENDALGTDSNARRYQPTIRDAFTMMMRHVPFDTDEVFVDVGSGKGKMLYYAAHLGYRRCIGIEIAPTLLEQARINFERLQLPVDIRLWQRDARALDMDELAELSLFFLANPFGEEIMKGFLNCLVESQKSHPRTLRIVYCVAIVEAPFASYGFVPAKIFEPGIDGWRFPRSVIYERQPDYP